MTNTSASTHHVMTELGALTRIYSSVLPFQCPPFPSGCPNPKAKRWYLGSLPQWLHLERLKEKGAGRKRREEKLGQGKREGGREGEISVQVTQFHGCHHDWGRPVLRPQDSPGKLTCLRKRPAWAANDCQDQKGMGQGRGSTGRTRMKTRKWREGERRQEGWEGEGQRRGIWSLRGWSQKAILHR